MCAKNEIKNSPNGDNKGWKTGRRQNSRNLFIKRGNLQKQKIKIGDFGKISTKATLERNLKINLPFINIKKSFTMLKINSSDKKTKSNKKAFRDVWTEEDEAQLFQIHQEYGNQWKLISQKLNRKDPNSVKNKFNAILKRKLRKVFKLLGIKNSSYLVKDIKPTVLSEVLNQPHIRDGGLQRTVLEILRELDERTQRVSKIQKSVLFNLVDIINSKNFEYIEDKESQKKPIQVSQIAKRVQETRKTRAFPLSQKQKTFLSQKQQQLQKSIIMSSQQSNQNTSSLSQDKIFDYNTVQQLIKGDMQEWQVQNSLFLDFEEDYFHERKSSFDECQKSVRRNESSIFGLSVKTPMPICIDEKFFDDEFKEMSIYDEIERNLKNKIAQNTYEILYQR